MALAAVEHRLKVSTMFARIPRFLRRWRAAPRRLVVALSAGLLCIAPLLHAQAPDDVRVTPSKDRSFRIPFQTQPNDRRLREVQLMVSTDQGRSWRLTATATPEQGFFQQFNAPQDGSFWFAVRTVDVQGRSFPPTDDGLRAGLKVLVDTVPPTLALEALPPQGGSVGVKWDARDDHLDPASLRVEYQVQGTGQWTPVRTDAIAAGQVYWTPMTNAPLEVRASVMDSVGNAGRAQPVLIGAAGSGNPNNPNPHAAGAQAKRLVNSKRISLNYKIEDVGPSGVSTVELWYTQDGRNWQKYGEDPKHTPPFTFDVNGEGDYGFTLLVRSGVGLGEKPPQVGDPPQVWVEVDLTRPVVRLLGVEVGQGPATGSLTISWTATDKNLGPQPTTLSYAENPEGPWTAITPTPVENNGRYVWRMPPGVPYQFHVKVEAADKAGNVGSAQTTQVVKVDLAKPKPTILDVAPANK